MKHQVIHLGKGQVSFFLQILVCVMVLRRDKWISKVICTTYLYNPPLSLTVLSYVNPSYLHFPLTLCFITLLPILEDMWLLVK